MRIVRSPHMDVAWNMALEEELLGRADARDPLLLLYVDRRAIVFGKNQNPWREIRVERARRAGAALARRISGGGTVYHDEGNLNASLILPRAAYDLDRQFAILLKAVESLGVPARRSGHSMLLPDGRKFSGHAFCLRKSAALHHATFLVRSDLGELRRLLEPPGAQVRTRATASRPAAVGNLGEFGVTMDALERSLTAAVQDYGEGSRPIGGENFPDANAGGLVERHRSWPWVFGRSPPAEVMLPWDAGGPVTLAIRGGETAEWTRPGHPDDEAFRSLQRVATCGHMAPEDLCRRLRRTAAGAPTETAARFLDLAQAIESAWS